MVGLSQFSPGDEIEYQINVGSKHRPNMKTKNGRILQITDKIISIQGEKYRSSIDLYDLDTGETKITVSIHAPARGATGPPIHLRVKETKNTGGNKVEIVLQDQELMPFKQYLDDAGIDLRAGESIILYPGRTEVITAGIRVKIPKNCVGIIKPRSSIFRQGIIIDGVIDSGYTGEVKIMCNNTSNDPIAIAKKDRIAQLIVFPCIIENIVLVDALEETERSNRGFGSTGAV